MADPTFWMASVCVHCEGHLTKTFDKAGMRSHNMNTHSKYKVECATCWNAFENECSKVQHFNEKHSVAGRHKRLGRHKMDKKKKKYSNH